MQPYKQDKQPVFDKLKMLSQNKQQIGFTLIELMVTVMIVAILAAIAVPSYRQYIVRNAESDAMASMKQMQLDLDRWRASALTYQGFVPKSGVDADGNITYGYANAPTNTIVYLPLGSTATNYRYQVTLVDGQNTTQSLVPTGTGINNVTGRTWRMLATPNPDGAASSGDRILMSSTGLQCLNASTALTIASTDCETGGVSW